MNTLPTVEQRSANQRRLQALVERSYRALLFDVDGVVRAKQITDPSTLVRHAELLGEGMILSPCTARGESLREAYLRPLQEQLLQRGIEPVSTGIYSCTRGGALIQQPFRGEIIEEHSLAVAQVEALLQHPLFQALLMFAPLAVVRYWQETHEKFNKTLGLAPLPLCVQYPGVFFDRHSNGKLYKLTIPYDLPSIQQALSNRTEMRTYRAAQAIVDAHGGVAPATAIEMAALLQRTLDAAQLPAALSASASEPYLDLIASGVSKARGYDAVKSLLTREDALPVDKLDQAIVTLGDSPQGNDAPLLACGVGVTNVDYWQNPALVVLDFPGISNQIARASRFFTSLKSPKSNPVP